MIFPVILQPHHCIVRASSVSAIYLSTVFVVTPRFLMEGLQQARCQQIFSVQTFFPHMCKLNGHMTKLTANCLMSGCNWEHCMWLPDQDINCMGTWLVINNSAVQQEVAQLKDSTTCISDRVNDVMSILSDTLQCMTKYGLEGIWEI